jgi:hypothetical protein
MLKKGAFLLILCSFLSHMSYSQYGDDAEAKDTTSMDSARDKPKFTEFLVPGAEFMINAGGGAFFAELSPFIGYRPVNPIMVGAGLHGSFLGAGQFGNYTYYGGHVFARIIIADKVFIHGEYRLMNGAVPGTQKQRIWVNSPIFGGGIMYGSQSYLLLGYATDLDFQQINPLQGLVYRLGIYF